MHGRDTGLAWIDVATDEDHVIAEVLALGLEACAPNGGYSGSIVCSLQSKNQ